jgi:hypothetical protein
MRLNTRSVSKGKCLKKLSRASFSEIAMLVLSLLTLRNVTQTTTKGELPQHKKNALCLSAKNKIK